MTDKRQLGKLGEDTALKHLKRCGYQILERNFRNRLGEIDIIARHKDTICFIEVKARRSPVSGLPAESVPLPKQFRLARTALSYLKYKKLLESKARFDVVSILGGFDGEAQIEIFQNAFDMPFVG